jgi:hypothetical protein
LAQLLLGCTAASAACCRVQSCTLRLHNVELQLLQLLG